MAMRSCWAAATAPPLAVLALLACYKAGIAALLRPANDGWSGEEAWRTATAYCRRRQTKVTLKHLKPGQAEKFDYPDLPEVKLAPAYYEAFLNKVRPPWLKGPKRPKGSKEPKD